MSTRWLAVVVGVLGIYLLTRAGFLGYGAFTLQEALRESSRAPDLFTPETSEIYRNLIEGFAVFGSFGILSVVSSIGLDRNRIWGTRLWLGTSVAMILCIIGAVVLMDSPWMQFDYEMIVVVVSWLSMAALARGKRREA